MSETTTVGFEGTVTSTVTFREGRYRYQCDPHANSMNGGFVVGNPAPEPNPLPDLVPAVTRLVATVGPKATISLRTV